MSKGKKDRKGEGRGEAAPESRRLTRGEGSGRGRHPEDSPAKSVARIVDRDYEATGRDPDKPYTI